ncbi:MAG: hydrogenase iron-sulfur subunit [Deltaproteobacteria bacterium]|nr:hydrogenase iron-sulfur subunit [Deltaproteobacteria bacterium]
MKKKITMFICVNLINEARNAILNKACKKADVKIVKIPCSGMIKKVFLLRAFEADSDIVAAFGCEQDQCRYMQGSLRAEKRVIRTKKILDEIDIESNRLVFFNISSDDNKEFSEIIEKILTERL